MKKIRKGDLVVLITGRDKGRKGAVIEVLADDRVRVEGLNMSKKHQRPNPQMGVQGGIIEREAPLHVSNVLVFNPATQKGDRVGFRALEDGRKVRVFKSNKEMVDAKIRTRAWRGGCGINFHARSASAIRRGCLSPPLKRCVSTRR